MKQRFLITTCGAILALGVTACSSDDTPTEPPTTAPHTTESVGPDEAEGSGPEESPDSIENSLIAELLDKKERGVLTEDEAEVLEFLTQGSDPLASGGPYVKPIEESLSLAGVRPNAVAIVQITDSEDVVGRKLAATAEFLDADGNVLEERLRAQRVHSPGQKLAFSFITFEDHPQPPASIKVSYEFTPTVFYRGLEDFKREPFEVVTSNDIRPSGALDRAHFTITNPTDQVLESASLTTVCRDADGALVDAGDYVFDAEASATVNVDTFAGPKGLATSCDAYINYPRMSD